VFESHRRRCLYSFACLSAFGEKFFAGDDGQVFDMQNAYTGQCSFSNLLLASGRHQSIDSMVQVMSLTLDLPSIHPYRPGIHPYRARSSESHATSQTLEFTLRSHTNALYLISNTQNIIQPSSPANPSSGMHGRGGCCPTRVLDFPCSRANDNAQNDLASARKIRGLSDWKTSTVSDQISCDHSTSFVTIHSIDTKS
jgi:hypothetical protein